MDEKQISLNLMEQIRDLQRQIFFGSENMGKFFGVSKRYLNEKNFGQCYHQIDKYIDCIDKNREAAKMMLNLILQYQNALKEELYK